MAENLERGRYLYIMRHGAADSDYSVLNDFNRSLSHRGVRETIRLIELMQQKKLREPDCILCSTALRARQTTELLRQLFPRALVLYREGLYLAPVFRLISTLNEMDDIFETVMIVGHHPGLEQAISYLTESADQPVLQPSDCAVVRLPYSCAWRSLLPGVGQMQLFFKSRGIKIGKPLASRRRLWYKKSRKAVYDAKSRRIDSSKKEKVRSYCGKCCSFK